MKMNRGICIQISCVFLASGLLKGEVPTNVTKTDLSAAVSNVNGDFLVMDNVRMKSDQSDLNDYIRATFVFDQEKLAFKPLDFKIYRNIGIFNNPNFARDVVPSIQANRGGENFNQDSLYSIYGTQPFVVNLSVGHVFSCIIDQSSKEFLLDLTGPDGEQVDSFRGEANQGIISGEVPIFKQGKYKLRIRPTDGSKQISYRIKFANANRYAIQKIKDGSILNFSFLTNLRDYGKASVYLKKGDVLRLTEPSNDLIKIRIINSRNKEMVNNLGLPVIFKAPSSGDYYVFINNSKGWGGSYYGTVNISKPTPLVSPVD